jgi:hypothetical protein
MVYVASRFEISRRRENLSWSHHEAIASLDPEEQERWLDHANQGRLSVADLRLELRAARKAASRAADPDGSEGDDVGELERKSSGATLVCPRCGEQLSEYELRQQ